MNKGNRVKYKEHDRRLKEQFLNGLNDEDIMAKNIELTALKDTSRVSCEWVLGRAQRVEVQRA